MFIPFSILSLTGMIILPLIVGFFVARAFKLGFKDFRTLFQAGALTFIASQILHIPLVAGLTALFSSGLVPSPDKSWVLIFNAIVLGLLAGLFEETARLILFRRFLQSTRTWRDGIIIGIGHGGIEAILLGIIGIATLINMIALKDVVDYSTLNIPPEQVAAVQSQVDAFWNQADAMPLFGLFERMSSMTLHVALSVLVLYGVVSGERKWYWIAVLYHALMDAVAVYFFAQTGGNLTNIALLEFVIAAMAFGVLAYAIRLRTLFPVEKDAGGLESP